MKKYIKTIALTIVCLLLSVVVFASCGSTQVYSGTFYEKGAKNEITFTQKSDNSFSLIQKAFNGDKILEFELFGKYKLSADKTKTESVEIRKFLIKSYVDGRNISSEDLLKEQGVVTSEENQILFGKDYVVFGGDYILYKKGAKKFANNEVIKVLTKKESTALNKLTKDAYDADFYIVKDEETPNAKLQLEILYSHFDYCKWTKAEITNVEGLNTSNLGKQNVTITYDVKKIGLTGQTLKATVMVVENEKQFPENLIEEVKVEVDNEETNYVELVQNGDISSSSIVLEYCTKSGKNSSDTDWEKLELNSGTKEGFQIEGLDNTKLGFQEVTVTHIKTGVSAKLTVNVIDPKTPVEIKTSGSVKIKADKTLDLSEAKYTITYVDGSVSEKFAVTNDDVILQGSIADYVNGDDMAFKVSVKFGDKTLVYYSTISVVVETA